MDQKKLAASAGISASHLSEVLRGISVPTIELVARLAAALKVQTWELVADSDQAKQAAWAKLLWGGAVANEKVEQHYPLPPATPAPPKEEAPKRKKQHRGARKSGGAPRNNEASQ